MLFAFPLSSCGETPLIDPKDCTKHVDSNKDGKCDLCGTTMEQEVCLNHYDADGDKKCDYCGVKMPSGKQTFKGLSLKNKVYDYDGKTHSLFVEGLPEFASVTYLNNDQTNAGKYKVTAIVKANNYNTKSLEANLTIRGMQFEGITFEDLEIDYDGQEHSIAVKGLPDFAHVEYIENGQKDPGRHKVIARVYADNYEELYLNAYIIIHGKLVANGTEQQIISETGSKNLEEAFMALTGEGNE